MWEISCTRSSASIRSVMIFLPLRSTVSRSQRIEHLVEKMRDEDDAEPFGPQLAHDGKEHAHFRRIKAGGGLVEDEDLARQLDRPGDRQRSGGMATGVGAEVAVDIDLHARTGRAARGPDGSGRARR